MQLLPKEMSRVFPQAPTTGSPSNTKADERPGSTQYTVGHPTRKRRFGKRQTNQRCRKPCVVLDGFVHPLFQVPNYSGSD